MAYDRQVESFCEAMVSRCRAEENARRAGGIVLGGCEMQKRTAINEGIDCVDVLGYAPPELAGNSMRNDSGYRSNFGAGATTGSAAGGLVGSQISLTVPP